MVDRTLAGCRGWTALSVAVGLAAIASPAQRAAASDDPLRLRSSSVSSNSTLANDQVYNGFGCAGKNISPALEWSGAPGGTQSFALTVYDPDAPGSGWWHWIVYDIPASATELAQGAGNSGGKLPTGAAQARSDFGTSGYGGPCPPKGDKPHRYIFTLYALKIDKLKVPASSTAAMIGSLIGANKLASATLTALYGR